MMQKITLQSKDNLNILHNKSSRKNKQNAVYTWMLERFQEKRETSFLSDVFPSSSIARKDSVFAFVRDNINTSHIFDFEYLPVERDFVVIVKKDNPDWWLRLIYLDGLWHEEGFINSYRDLLADKYTLINSGEIRPDSSALLI
jgi:hypothetical protein